MYFDYKVLGGKNYNSILMKGHINFTVSHFMAGLFQIGIFNFYKNGLKISQSSIAFSTNKAFIKKSFNYFIQNYFNSFAFLSYKTSIMKNFVLRGLCFRAMEDIINKKNENICAGPIFIKKNVWELYAFSNVNKYEMRFHKTQKFLSNLTKNNKVNYDLHCIFKDPSNWHKTNNIIIDIYDPYNSSCNPMNNDYLYFLQDLQNILDEYCIYDITLAKDTYKVALSNHYEATLINEGYEYCRCGDFYCYCKKCC